MTTPSGVVTLGQVAARLLILDVACNRCRRHGRLRADRLLAEHGSGLSTPDLRCIIAADCPCGSPASRTMYAACIFLAWAS